jgi:hypothetical protein
MENAHLKASVLMMMQLWLSSAVAQPSACTTFAYSLLKQ